MNELITTWLLNQGVTSNYLEVSALGVGLTIILLFSTLSYYLVKHKVLNLVYKLIAKTKNTWDDALIKHNVLIRMTFLLPIIAILFLTPLVLPSDALLAGLMILLAKVLLTFQLARTVSALLNVSKSLYRETAKEKYLPCHRSQSFQGAVSYRRRDSWIVLQRACQ